MRSDFNSPGCSAAPETGPGSLRSCPELPLLLFRPHGGVVPPPLTNVSFESSVLVSSGVSLHSHPLPPSLCVFVCPPLPLPFHGVPLEDKKHPVCLDLAASKS